MTEADTGAFTAGAQIAELFRRYGEAVVNADSDAWCDCWVSDAPCWIVTKGDTVVMEGLEMILPAWRERMASFKRVAFRNSIIAVHPDGYHRAVVESRTEEKLHGVDGTVTHTSGRYDDIVVREAAGWRFAQRHFTFERELG